MSHYRKAVRSKARLVEMLKKKGKPVDEDSIPLPPQTESSGLGTTLRPIYGNPQDSHFPVPKEVEAYLYDVEKELFDYIEQIKAKDPRKIHGLKSKINSMLCNLHKRADLVAIPTDKTNSYVLITTDNLKKQLTVHLEKDAVKTTTDHLKEILSKAKEFLETIKETLINLSSCEL